MQQVAFPDQQQVQNMPPKLVALTLAQAPMPLVDQTRKRIMKDAWRAYRGDFPDPLKVNANQPNDNTKVNRCSPIVDKGVSFLFGPTLKIECAGHVLDSNPLQDFVDGLWGDDDEKMTLLSKMAMNGGVCGQVFVKIIPAQGQMKYPRLVVLDPLLVRVVTPPDDCSLILAYIIEYPGPDTMLKRQVIARVDPDGMAGITGEFDLDDTWTITNYCQMQENGSFFQVGKQDVWDYPFAPIIMCQNLPNPNEVWGVPDLTQDLIGVNKVLNFIQSNTSRIIKYHGHPKTIVTGVGAAEFKMGIDDTIFLPSETSKAVNLEAHTDFNGLLNFAETLRSDMDEQSRVPAVALGRATALPRGNISGVALQLLFQPLIEKTVQKQRLYGCFIREVTRCALVISGLLDIMQYESYPIELHWQNLLPVDDLAAAQTAILLQQLGVSQDTILQQLGYQAEDERTKTQTEQQHKLTAFSKGQGLPSPVASGMPEYAQQNVVEGGGE